MTDRPPAHPRDGSADDALLLSRVKAVLSPMPAVDQRHVAQILAAAQARRRTPSGTSSRRPAVLWSAWHERWRVATSPLVRTAALAAAALAVGFVGRGYLTRPSIAAPRPADSVAALGATPAAVPLQAVEAAAQVAGRRWPTQFLLDARAVPQATQVSVVGDFNDWDVTATPLTLENGVWSGTLPLAPGRHVYAFVVNGDRWVADPRAPRAIDADFGRPGSILLVEAP